jgi:hypothetical protein
MSNTLTTIQEVYFDLCDLIENNNLTKTRIKGFYEFENLDQFIQEQKTKMAQIEKALDFQIKQHER